MNTKYRILLSFSAITVFIILLKTNLSPFQIYLIGVLYNFLYAVLYNYFKTDESQEKEDFVYQFISKDLVKTLDTLLCFTSWIAPIINIVIVFYNSLKENNR